jgi:hypothetical protein
MQEAGLKCPYYATYCHVHPPTLYGKLFVTGHLSVTVCAITFIVLDHSVTLIGFNYIQEHGDPDNTVFQQDSLSRFTEDQAPQTASFLDT